MIKYETGDVICYKSTAKWYNFFMSKTDFVSFLIKIGTFSKYTHVGIVLDVDNDKVIIGQALQDFDISNEYHYMNTLQSQDMILVKRYPKLTSSDKAELIYEAYKIEGVGYDWKGIFSLAFHIISGKTLFKDNANKFFCSEAVDYLFNKIGVKLFSKPSCKILPCDFAESKKLIIIE